MIEDLWRVHTRSLLEYLMGRERVYRPDFSDQDPQVRCEMEIEAPPAIVFEVLIHNGFTRVVDVSDYPFD